MEIKFQDKLKYQQDAIQSVIGLFKGQPKLSDKEKSSNISLKGSEALAAFEGYGNFFDISFQDIEENFISIQDSNGLPKNDKLNSLDFTVEMETGTGKTYVYLRTILELNQKYGFSKFVIVVPSIAIKEGVKKTIDITRNHFSSLYNNISYTDFIFNSGNMHELETFMQEDNIQIMIITIQSFDKKDMNRIHKETENGIIPINFIRKTNPIVIIDEPQSTASTDNQKEAIGGLNPLFTLQYSATPKDVENLVYQLNAVDAYNKNLVKKIEVNGFSDADYQGRPYVKLLSVKQTKSGNRTAEVSLVKNTPQGLNTSIETIKVDDKLSVDRISNNSAYDNYIVRDIVVRKGDEHVLFYNDEKVYLNSAINDINQEEVRKAQIEETIRQHLDKELKLAKKNIKVLSLFFIDKVSNYKYYDEDGVHKGKYAIWFENAYKKVLAENPDYKKLPNYILNQAAEDVHKGYFSIDKTKSKKAGEDVFKETEVDRNGNVKDNQANNDAFNLIMRKKEELLNPKNSLRFIFSHSALKEGWDNPNVFQICTFIEAKSDLSKRQKIGRGLRLCVDGDGNRVDETYGDGEEFKTINRLTVLANESFDNFAKSLQTEMEADGIQFDVVKEKDFKGISFVDRTGRSVKTDNYHAQRIWKSLLEQNLIDKKGKITRKWKSAVVDDTIELPEEYKDIKYEIIEIVSSKSASNYIKKPKDRISVTLDEEKLEEPIFTNLWDKIKYKSYYRVNFDSEELIRKCVKDMKFALRHIQQTKVTHTIVDLEMDNKIHGITRTNVQHFIDVRNDEIPNVVEDLQKATHLTKKTIIEILIRSDEQDNTLEKLLINPTEYYNKTLEVIQDKLSELTVETIEYHKIEGDEYDTTKFIKSFDEWVVDNDFVGSKLVKADKSLYDYVKCDSGIEIKFAQELENLDNVEFFLKLPNWFKIQTPRGEYNPDWAITVRVNGKPQTYFVIETKGSSKSKDLRQVEKDKICCGFKHFELVEDLDYDYCPTYDEFSKKYIFEN